MDRFYAEDRAQLNDSKASTILTPADPLKFADSWYFKQANRVEALM